MLFRPIIQSFIETAVEMKRAFLQAPPYRTTWSCLHLGTYVGFKESCSTKTLYDLQQLSIDSDLTELNIFINYFSLYEGKISLLS